MRCPFCRKGLAEKVIVGHLRNFHGQPAYAALMALALRLRDEEKADGKRAFLGEGRGS
jgi:hypothetical protein